MRVSLYMYFSQKRMLNQVRDWTLVTAAVEERVETGFRYSYQMNGTRFTSRITSETIAHGDSIQVVVDPNNHRRSIPVEAIGVAKDIRGLYMLLILLLGPLWTVGCAYFILPWFHARISFVESLAITFAVGSFVAAVMVILLALDDDWAVLSEPNDETD